MRLLSSAGSLQNTKGGMRRGRRLRNNGGEVVLHYRRRDFAVRNRRQLALKCSMWTLASRSMTSAAAVEATPSREAEAKEGRPQSALSGTRLSLSLSALLLRAFIFFCMKAQFFSTSPYRSSLSDSTFDGPILNLCLPMLSAPLWLRACSLSS